VHEGIGAGGRRGVHADVVAAGVGGADALWCINTEVTRRPEAA
jgi:hypothetical protein